MENLDWKDRAIVRRMENKKLKKRIKELIISRDEWKIKAMQRISIINTLNKDILTIKKNLSHIIKI